jgi:hypothetical protein
VTAWALLPVVGTPIAHGPVMATDSLRALKRPLDGGRTFRGRRLFGANKTWRGALIMSGGAVAAAHVLHRIGWYREKLPPELVEAGPWKHGAAVGLAVVVGELPNSFVKRQLDIAPGARRWTASGIAMVIFDQADFVPMTALALRPWHRMPLRDLAEGFAIVTAIHLGVNVVGYAIGARDEWI